MESTVITRLLALADIPELLQLESRQWSANQAADADVLLQRLIAYPDLCIGAFCSRTNIVLASLFMRPIARNDIGLARCWDDCAMAVSGSDTRPSDCLFGISLTSIAPEAATALFEFFWPRALKNGWREIYLGSPVPGLKRALGNDPTLDAQTYVHARRGGLPLDPQLRYYHKKGFTHVVAVLPNYFPHEASLDYGVLIRGIVPLSFFCPLWKLLPFGMLQSLLKLLVRVERLQLRRRRPTIVQGAAS